MAETFAIPPPSGPYMSDAFHILVAEDNPDDVFLLRQACKRAGMTHPVHAVCDGWELIEYLEGNGAFRDRIAYPAPDVLLLDLNMPRRSGFEVLEWIRQDPRWRCLTVHVLSASVRDTDVNRAYELGANSYVVKPGGLDELVAFIAALQNWHRFAIPCRTRGVPAANPPLQAGRG